MIMATYNELEQRIKELKSRTGKGSISPRETFDLMDELLSKTKGVDMTAQPLVVVKSYDTLALANADRNPINPATNKPLALGQLISITADGANNAVYRLAALAADGSPTWEKQAELGDMTNYAKQTDLVQLAGEYVFDESTLTGINLAVKHTNGVNQQSDRVRATDYLICRGFDFMLLTNIVDIGEPTTGIVFYDQNKTYISGVPRDVGEANSYNIIAIEIPDNAYYFKTNWWLESIEPTKFSCVLFRDNDSVSYVEKETELYPESGINANTGVRWDYLGSKNAATDFIDIRGAERIRLTVACGTSITATAGLAFYDQYKTYISGYVRPYSATADQYRIVEYIVPDNAHYVRSTYYSEAFLPMTNFPKFFLYAVYKSQQISSEIIESRDVFDVLKSKLRKLKRGRLYVHGNLDSLYECNYAGPIGTSMASLTMNDVYENYDSLLSSYPNIIQKNTLGYATSVDGEDNLGYPIYEYVIKQPERIQYLTKQIPLYAAPTILLQSGVHGPEKISVQALYEFISNMLSKWHENELLFTLFSNFEFRIIPLTNPWGYDNNIRNNIRDVNINRNLGWRWEFQEGSEASKKGSSPYSERESQVLRDWYTEHSDALVLVDYHDTSNSDSSKNAFISYQATVNEDLMGVYSSLLRKLSAYWIKKYSIATNHRSLGWIENAAYASTYVDAFYSFGIKNTSTVEINRMLWGENYSQTACEIACMQVVNYLCAVIKYEIDILSLS